MRRFTMLSLQSRFALPTVIGLVIALVVPASAQDISDLRRQREQARAAEQEALEQIDLLRADDALVAEVLAELQGLVDAQIARVAGAQQALAAAESEVLYREQLARDAEAAFAVMREEIAVRAVDSYVGTNTSLEPWLESGDPNRTAIRLAMLDFAAGSERDLLDGLRTAQAEMEENVRLGEAARVEADLLREAYEVALGELEERRAVQLDVQAELQVRIDEWIDVANERDAASDEFTSLIREATAAATGLNVGSPSLEGYVMPTSGSIGSASVSYTHLTLPTILLV